MTTREHELAEVIGAQKGTRAFWVLGQRLTLFADHADTGGHYNLFAGRQPPGNRTLLYLHTRYDERLYVMNGDLTFWADGLQTGDTFANLAGSAHFVAATGEGVTHALVVASPSGFAQPIKEVGVPDTGGAPPEPTSADIGRFLDAAARLGDEQLVPPGTLSEL